MEDSRVLGDSQVSHCGALQHVSLKRDLGDRACVPNSMYLCNQTEPELWYMEQTKPNSHVCITAEVSTQMPCCAIRQ